METGALVSLPVPTLEFVIIASSSGAGNIRVAASNVAFPIRCLYAIGGKAL